MLDLPDQLEERFNSSSVSLARCAKEPSVAVDILSIATATPEYKITQAEALSRVNRVLVDLRAPFRHLHQLRHRNALFLRAPEWCERHHGWEERMDVYQRHALELLEKVARKSVAAAGLSLPDIDVIVTNSTTGLAVPSIDALLINRLPLRETVTRLPIFGFGCSGGAAGLARAAQFAQSMPGANILLDHRSLQLGCPRQRPQPDELRCRRPLRRWRRGRRLAQCGPRLSVRQFVSTSDRRNRRASLSQDRALSRLGRQGRWIWHGAKPSVAYFDAR